MDSTISPMKRVIMSRVDPPSLALAARETRSKTSQVKIPATAIATRAVTGRSNPGGLPALGYDVQNRKLVINEQDALTVCHIFRRYVQLRSVRALRAELDEKGVRSKRRIFADGTQVGGQRFSRGALSLMLQNRVYRGEITHKGDAYPGEHQPIVDKALWDEVQAVLAENRIERATGSDAKHPSLLAGMFLTKPESD